MPDMKDGNPRASALSRLHAVAAALAPPLLRLLGRTWSVRVLNRRVLRDCIDSGRPVLVATWHQMIIPGVVFFRDRRAVILVSRSRDGDLIARINIRMGFRNVRGSSSRSGVAGLHALIGLVRAGAQAALMVDGPRGPAQEPKSGCVAAARLAGVPLVPLACRARWAVRARNWDRTLLPLPFARIVLSFGDPIHVPADETPEACERARLRIRDELVRAGEAADRALAGELRRPRGFLPFSAISL